MTAKTLLASETALTDLTISGWVRTRRDSKQFSFLEINDGSCLANVQVVADAGIPGYDDVSQLTTGASVEITGKLVESPGKNQKWELHAASLKLLGTADDSYPLQKKGHGVEFLRTIPHLRARTNLFGAVFRVRSKISFAVHQFFQERGFHHVHTPIITTSDCEGAGEMFRISAGEKEFFGDPAYLTVSGQLEGETLACGLGSIYTFGPTFRAENSHTTRHASEFWMIEPEVAFADLEADMTLAEENVHYLIAYALEHCAEDLAFFNKFLDKSLIERLTKLSKTPFQRVTYTEAVDILQKCDKKFDYPVEWGTNLQSEHERFLTEEHFKTPVTVYNYPKKIKPFYMRQNDDCFDGSERPTVAAMDLLVPGIGELIGGSQREERAEILDDALRAHDLDPESYKGYTDLRRYGTVPHAGYGLGFERLLMFLTGVSNIRDVLPYPRTPA